MVFIFIHTVLPKGIRRMLFTEIMKENSLFMRCFRKGKYVSCPFVTAYFINNGLPFNRFGISVGKKQGGAVERNRIKRVFRAAYRAAETQLPIGVDIVFCARGNAAQMTFAQTEEFIYGRLCPAMKNALSQPKIGKASKNRGASFKDKTNDSNKIQKV